MTYVVIGGGVTSKAAMQLSKAQILFLKNVLGWFYKKIDHFLDKRVTQMAEVHSV